MTNTWGRLRDHWGVRAAARILVGTVVGSCLLVIAVTLLVLAGPVDLPTIRAADRPLTAAGRLVEFRDIQEGDCVVEVPRPAGEGLLWVRAVPCTEPHTSQFFGRFEIRGAKYPGDDEMAETANTRCPAMISRAVGDGPASTHGMIMYLPTEASWDGLGDRQVVCGLKFDPAVTGSITEQPA